MSDLAKAVQTIKTAILNAQYNAVKATNSNQLSLYYGIGKYKSKNSRAGFWGTNAIQEISRILQTELPRLRGFSERSIKNLRQFYEEWESVIFRQPLAANLAESEPNGEIINNALLVLDNKSNLDTTDFLSISFTHHMEILNKTKDLQERIFYIHNAAVNFWSKYTLREYLKEDLFHNQGLLPNNFTKTISEPKIAANAIATYRTQSEIPEKYRNALPNIDEMKKLLDSNVGEK